MGCVLSRKLCPRGWLQSLKVQRLFLMFSARSILSFHDSFQSKGCLGSFLLSLLIEVWLMYNKCIHLKCIVGWALTNAFTCVAAILLKRYFRHISFLVSHTLSHTLTSIPLPQPQPLFWLFSPLVDFPFSRSSYKWNHVIHTLLCLVSFAQGNVF